MGWWWLAPAGPALLLAALNPGRHDRAPRPYRRAAGLALLAGLVYLVPLLSWAQAPGVDAWVALAVAEAVLFAALGPALLAATALPMTPLWIAIAWVTNEALRDSVPFGGFPWARLAFTQPDTPFTRWAALGGAPLVSFAVALSGGAIGWALVTHRRKEAAVSGRRLAGRAVTAAAVTGGVVLGGWVVPVPTGSGARTVTLAVVQGSVPTPGYTDFRRARLVTGDHLAETEVLARRVAAGELPQPRLVIWPENSSDLDPFHDPLSAAMLDRAAAVARAPVLVGAVLDGPRPGTVYNAGLAWGPHGWLGQLYLKRHPVPFGEYLPYRAELSRWFSQFRRLLPNDFLPGRRPGLFHLAGVPISDVICFEVAFDPLVRQAVNAGGQLLVVQTNNATFGRGSGESPQQLAMAQLRAVESDRATVVASTTGISALIAPDGHLIATTREFTPALLEAALPLQTGHTVADRIGDLPDLLCGLLAAAGAAWLLVLTATRRRRRPGVE